MWQQKLFCTKCTCYCHVLRTTANRTITGNLNIHLHFSKTLNVSKSRSQPDRRRNYFSSFTLKLQSLWLHSQVSRHLHLHLLAANYFAVCFSLWVKADRSSKSSDGRPLLEVLHRWEQRAAVSRWKMIRCRNWWRQRLGPQCSPLLRQARGRPACCHEQWRRCYRSVSLKNKSTWTQREKSGKNSLEQVRIQTLQDHFVPDSHNRNSLWHRKHTFFFIP